MSMVLQCTELRMSKCKGSCVLSIKWNMYLNIQQAAMFVFWVSHESDITLSIDDLSVYKISWSHFDYRKLCIHLSSLKIPPSPHSKGPLKKVIIPTKLAGMYTIVHCIKFRLYKCNGSWAVSIKQTGNFKIQPPAMFVFFVFAKMIVLEVQNCLLGCTAVLNNCRPTFQRCVLPPSSRTSETSVDNYFTWQYIPEDNSEQD
jgi:hypothetical protein